jgi:tRNA pseudouridine55 synthase
VIGGFLIIDKPCGPTSHDVVATVRKITKTKRVGHAGTLDPMATGVVVVALGRCTRLIRFIQDAPKEYEATARFGEMTDTLDADGQILAREPMSFTAEELVAVSKRFIGTIMQVPPMVSALKVGGRRLYEIAREGGEVERQPRPVEIHELEILEVGPPPYPDVTFRVVCGKGTYVRSLADDMAAALGGRAHLTALRRTRVGAATLGGAIDLVDLEAQWPECLLQPTQVLAHMKQIAVTPDVAEAVGHGVVFAHSPAPDVDDGAEFCLVDDRGSLLAVYRAHGVGARPEVVLA